MNSAHSQTNLSINSIHSVSKFKQQLGEGNKEYVQKFLSNNNVSQQELNKGLFDCIDNYQTKKDNTDCMFLLIRFRANVNCVINGKTPLINACIKGQQSLVRCLLQNGAKIQQKDQLQNHPLFYVMNTNKQNSDVAQLIIQKMQSVNIQISKKIDPLTMAIQKQFDKILKKLIDKGATINKINEQTGDTLMHMVCKKQFKNISKQKKIIKLLSSKINLQTKNKEGKLAIQYLINEQCKLILQQSLKPKLLIKQRQKQKQRENKQRQKQKQNKQRQKQKQVISIKQKKKILPKQQKQDNFQLELQQEQQQFNQQEDQDNSNSSNNNNTNIINNGSSGGNNNSNSGNNNRKEELQQQQNDKKLEEIVQQSDQQKKDDFQKQKQKEKKLKKSIILKNIKSQQTNSKNMASKNIKTPINNNKQTKQSTKLNTSTGSITTNTNNTNINPPSSATSTSTITILNTKFEKKQITSKTSIKKINNEVLTTQKQKQNIQIKQNFLKQLIQRNKQRLEKLQKAQSQFYMRFNNLKQQSLKQKQICQQIYKENSCKMPILSKNVISTILAKQIKKFVKDQQLKCKGFQQMNQQIINQIQNLFNIHFPDIKPKIYLYGSQASGLFLNFSDIDLVISCSTIQSFQFLSMIQAKKIFYPNQSFKQVKFISNATIPIIKILLSQKYLLRKVDITFQTYFHNGVRCNQLLRQFLKQEPLIKPLVLILKNFFYAHALNDTYTGGLGSYSLVLMVVAFLQCTDVNKNQQNSLGNLLIQFLHFYGYKMDYICKSILVYFPQFKQYPVYNVFPLPNTQDTTPKLIIHDPLNPVNNVGRSTFKIQKIKNLIMISYNKLFYNFRCINEKCIWREQMNQTELKTLPCCILNRFFQNSTKIFEFE